MNTGRLRMIVSAIIFGLLFCGCAIAATSARADDPNAPAVGFTPVSSTQGSQENVVRMKIIITEGGGNRAVTDAEPEGTTGITGKLIDGKAFLYESSLGDAMLPAPQDQENELLNSGAFERLTQ